MSDVLANFLRGYGKHPLRHYENLPGPAPTGDVRHEVARVFLKEMEIRCSATGTLPSRALGVTLGVEALGILYVASA